MSGHNKWSKIKHKKGITDAKKSKVYSKIVKLINIEAKEANGDINSPGLRNAINKAKEVNMPSDNIDRAIKKGMSKEQVNMESVTYEAYGPGGSGIIIDGLTDNRNRASAEIKHILSKNNLSLAQSGSVSWSFEKKDGDWFPKSLLSVSLEDIEKIEKIVDELEDNDEVQKVSVNVDLIT